MNTFFSSLPWPVYILFAFGAPAIILYSFIRNRKIVNSAIFISFIMISCSPISAGLIKIDSILNNQMNIPKWLPLLGLLGIPLLLIAGYKSTKDNPEKRRAVLLAILLCSFGIVLIASIVIMKLLQKKH